MAIGAGLDAGQRGKAGPPTWLALREAMSSMSGPGVAVSARQARANRPSVEMSGIAQPYHDRLLTVGCWNISVSAELLAVARTRGRT